MRRVILLSLAAICLSSCGANSIPTAATPPLSTSLASIDHTLNWVGTTSDGLVVGFRMSADHVNGIYIELPEVQADACVFGAGGFSIDGFDNFDLNWGRPGPPIANGAFTVASNAPIQASSTTGRGLATVAFVLSGRITGESAEGSGDFSFSTNTSTPACALTRRLTWIASEK